MIVNRINIIGPPGSGKTTLARELSELYRLPIIHMDKIAHTPKYDPMHDKPAFTKKIQELCKQDKWIMEGVYKSTLRYRMPRADVTYYLDFKRRVYIYRVLKRRVQYHNKVRDEMPSYWKEKINWAFFKYVMAFYKEQKPHIDTELKSYKDKRMNVFTSPKDLSTYVQDLKK